MSDTVGRLLPVEAASKSYGGRWVLQELDVTLQPWQVMALPGPDGAGKSTATSVMNGRVLQVMQAGPVVVKSDPDLDRSEVRRAGLSRLFFRILSETTWPTLEEVARMSTPIASASLSTPEPPVGRCRGFVRMTRACHQELGCEIRRYLRAPGFTLPVLLFPMMCHAQFGVLLDQEPETRRLLLSSDLCFGVMSPSVRVRRIHGRGTGQCRPDACTGAARIHSAFRGMGDAPPADQGGSRR